VINAIVIIFLSYLVGSIPGSLWVGRVLYGVDVREHGSGNMGATNTFRVLGWKAGLLSTVVDLGKGLLAAGVIATIRVTPSVIELPFWNPDVLYQMLAGAAAVFGHMFPVWAGFRGGKGMNTSAGVLFAITPWSMWITVSVFVIVLVCTRYVSLGSLAAAITFPVTVAIRKYVFGIDRLDASILVLSLIIAAGLIYAHRANIRRLVMGKENRIRTFRPARGMAGRGEL
jgi:glycerol-3-phosphate acyltransferase PlsY